jgi:hypothetical protein
MATTSITNEKRIAIEQRIARRIIKDALASGYRISVHDGEEYALSRSDHGPTIFAAMFSTDDDRLYFSTAEGKRIGWVWLVYGNDGTDVICDCSVNKETNEILAGASALADRIGADL